MPRTLSTAMGRAAGAVTALALAACGSAPPPVAPQAKPATAEASAPVQRTPPTKITVNGMPFVYESYGDGFPVVFLHGSSDRRSVVPRGEPIFAGSTGWQRLYPDLPGAGDTPARPSIKDIDGYIAELHAFFDQVLPGKKIALAGFSWGGYVALAYAKRHPERLAGIALVVPALGMENSERPKPMTIVDEPGAADGLPPPVAQILGQISTVHTRAIYEQLLRDVLPGVQSFDRQFNARVASTRPPGSADVHDFTFDGPSLVVAGKQDPVTGYVEARMLAERLPRATYAMVDRASHAVPVEQPQLFRALVSEWLGRVREGNGEKYQKPM